MKIPFNRPVLLGRELANIAEAIANGNVGGDGPFTKRCQALLEQMLGVPKVLLTTSCTHALEMCALLLDLAPGDEVLVPSFTFVTTAGAFVLRGARPVFVDVRSDTLNIDESLVENLITERTRAIVAVHYAGVGCEMDALMSIASRRGLAVIEDNAHGLFGKYRGRALGTFGALATQSFHETKNVICGEGGALVINDARYAERAEILREKGTNRARFFRGEVDKYTWIDLGSSYVPSDILAAFLHAKLEVREEIQRRRRAIWERYRDGLRDWADGNGARLPSVPGHCEQAYHMFYLLLPTAERRQAFLAHMKQHGILAVFHYVPLHLSPMGQRFGYSESDLPVTRDVSERLVRLPFFNDLSVPDQDRVMEVVRLFRC